MIRKMTLSATITAALFFAVPAHAQDMTTLQNDLNAKYKSGTVLVIQKNGITGEAPNNSRRPALPPGRTMPCTPPTRMCTARRKNYSKALPTAKSESHQRRHPRSKTKKSSSTLPNAIPATAATPPPIAAPLLPISQGLSRGWRRRRPDRRRHQSGPRSAGPNADQNRQQQGGQQQQGGDQQQAQQQPQQQAPPQPPAPPASIQLGQTVDQVTASFGPPEKIVNLGTKQIYVYKDLKVTFVNGKVTDVQ